MVLSCLPHRINGPRKERGPWQEDDGRKVQCTCARTNDSPILGGAGTLRPWKPKRASCACSATYASVMHGTLQSRAREKGTAGVRGQGQQLPAACGEVSDDGEGCNTILCLR